MKKLVLGLLLSSFCISVSFGQNGSDSSNTSSVSNSAIVEDIEIPSEVKKPINVTYVSKTAVLEKFHNEVELEKLGKLELTQLYIDRVTILTEIMPYIALSTHAAGENLKNLGVPETKANVSDLQKEVKSKEAYIENIHVTLNDVIPYSDTDKIIWSILFMEDIIHRVEAQKKTY